MTSSPTKVLAVIPVRMSSSRLPGKPLADIAGKTLVERVYERALKARSLSKVVIATDDTEIERRAKALGAEVLMTSSNLETGSDRVAQALEILNKRSERYDLVANVQGDMPFIEPLVIDRAVKALDSSPDFQIATIATPIMEREEFERSSSVKVVLGDDGRALYFSRSPIPYWRDRPDSFIASEQEPYGYKHIGLYIFRAEALLQLKSFKRTQVEKRESLEQLRALAHGLKIKIEVIPLAQIGANIEVDTSSDLERARSLCKS